jgi:hypothetical protein
MCGLGNAFSVPGPWGQNGRLTIALAVSLAFCLWPGPVQAKYDGGTGTANDPYLIRTAEQFNGIGAAPSDWDKYFKLVADIDLSEYSNTAYHIIGTEVAQSFSGVFDGNDHTISKFTLNSTRQWYTGLFGYVSGQIKNLGLVKPNVFSQGSSVGALAGYLDSGTITGCYASRVDVAGDDYIGGLVGWSTGRIFNCYSTGNVAGDWYVGGLVGFIADSTVNMSFSKANASGSTSVGGLAGMTGDETSVVSNCYATGAVNGGIYAGGLVGQVERGRTYKCYSTGRVSGNQYVGGFTGYIRVLGDVIFCFWDTQASGQATSPGGTGKTTDEMRTITTFTDAGWDFWNIWTICAGTNYPVLLWQIPSADFQCPDGVDLVDFAFFAAHWHLQNCNVANYFCEGTDVNHSGAVDFSDLEIFANRWLEGIP